MTSPDREARGRRDGIPLEVIKRGAGRAEVLENSLENTIERGERVSGIDWNNTEERLIKSFPSYEPPCPAKGFLLFVSHVILPRENLIRYEL